MIIRLDEHKLSILKELMLQEAQGPDYWSNKFKQELDFLNTHPQIRESKYKWNNLENAYKAWEGTGYDKNSREYRVWGVYLKKWIGFFDRHLHFLLQKKDRCGDMASYQVIFDPKWVRDGITKNKEEFECYYTTLLKLCQNKEVWNDLFFNPMFENVRNSFIELKDWVVGKIMEFKSLLPLAENKEVATYLRTAKPNPELFYTEEGNNNDEPVEMDGDVDFDNL